MFFSVKNLKKNFSDYIVLYNINFTFDKEDIVTILGESGAGKSTLLKCLNGLLPVDSGEIIFKNKNIYLYNPLNLRKNICYISQIPVSICDKTIDEFKFVKKELSIEKLQKIFKEFKLTQDILKKDMKNLSIGQQQRIAILRGILNKPEIILLDEPTSALDEENISLLTNIIMQLNKENKTSFIIVTHNLNFAEKISNKQFILKNGTLNAV